MQMKCFEDAVQRYFPGLRVRRSQENEVSFDLV